MYLAGTRLNHSAKATYDCYTSRPTLIYRTILSSPPLCFVTFAISLTSADPHPDPPTPLPTTTTTPAPEKMATSAAAAGCSATYWCYECDMGVAISFAAHPLLCPHCRGRSLEHMDLPPDPNPGFDDLLLDHLSLAFAHPEPDLARPVPDAASIPTLTITPDILAADGAVICAVCKDEFAVGVDAKQLPCRHIYHADCILPWLSHHDSCPVCRFRLPSSSPAAAGGRGLLRLDSGGGSEEEPEPDPYLALLRTLQRVYERRSDARAVAVAVAGAAETESGSPMGGLAD